MAFFHHIATGDEVVSGISHGMVEQFRRPEVTLYDSPDQKHGTMRTVWPEGRIQVADLMTQILTPQKPCICVVHPDQWDMARDTFESLGYIVHNGDAPFTPFR